MSLKTIRHNSKVSLRKKLKKRRQFHSIYKRALAKRKGRSWNLYHSSSAGRYKDVITADEAWFNLKIAGNNRDRYYYKIDMVSRPHWPLTPTFLKDSLPVRVYQGRERPSYNGYKKEKSQLLVLHQERLDSFFQFSFSLSWGKLQIPPGLCFR